MYKQPDGHAHSREAPDRQTGGTWGSVFDERCRSLFERPVLLGGAGLLIPPPGGQDA